MKFLVRMTSTDILDIEDKEKEVSKSDASKKRKKRKRKKEFCQVLRSERLGW